MLAAGFQPLEPYESSNRGWLSRCSKCGNDSRPSLQNIKKGQGCRFCAHNAPVDSVEAVGLMVAARLEPLEPFKSSHAPWSSRCMACGKTVSPSYSGVRSGKRCGFCAGNVRIDPEEAANLMRAAGLEPLQSYTRSSDAWPCRCMTCGAEVSPSYTGVRSGKRCRYCQGQVVTRERAIADMRKAGLEPLEPYKSANAAWLCRCRTCGAEVRPTRSGILSGKGCQSCGRKTAADAKRMDPDAAAAHMAAAGLEPLEPYPGYNDVPWRCRCLSCDRVVSPRYANVRIGQGGCRYCAKAGFQLGNEALVYVITHAEFNAHKIGIAGVTTHRLDKHRKNGWSVFKTMHFDRGEDAYAVEQSVLKWLREELSIPPFLAEMDGWTETLSSEEVPLPTLWARVEATAESVRLETSEAPRA